MDLYEYIICIYLYVYMDVYIRDKFLFIPLSIISDTMLTAL